MYFQVNMKEMPQVQLLGQIRQPAGWTNEVSETGQEMLILVQQGDMHFQVNQRRYDLKASDFLFLPSGSRYRVSSKGSCQYHFVHFVLCESLKAEESSPFRKEPADEKEQSRRVDHQFGLAYSRPEDVHVADCGHLVGEQEKIWLLLTECDMYRYETTANRKMRIDLRFSEILNLLDRGEDPSNAGGYPALLTQILFYIHRNYDRPLSLTDLSETFLYSKQYIMRLFQKYLHTTANHYITIIKLEHALDLLRFSAHQVCEIAEMVGFGSNPYFNRVFRKNFGVTPTEYRRKCS